MRVVVLVTVLVVAILAATGTLFSIEKTCTARESTYEKSGSVLAGTPDSS